MVTDYYDNRVKVKGVGEWRKNIRVFDGGGSLLSKYLEGNRSDFRGIESVRFCLPALLGLVVGGGMEKAI